MSETAFIARASPWRMALHTAACLGIVAGGLWLARADDAELTAVEQAVGWLNVVLFVPPTILCAPGIFRHGPVIRVDASGIWWRRRSRRTVPWSAIVRLDVMPLPTTRGRTLCLTLREPAAYPAESRLERWASRHRLPGYGDLAIVTGGTDVRFEALVAAARRFAPGHVAFADAGGADAGGR